MTNHILQCKKILGDHKETRCIYIYIYYTHIIHIRISLSLSMHVCISLMVLSLHIIKDIQFMIRAHSNNIYLGKCRKAWEGYQSMHFQLPGVIGVR